jgi:hypothetical protein
MLSLLWKLVRNTAFLPRSGCVGLRDAFFDIGANSVSYTGGWHIAALLGVDDMALSLPPGQTQAGKILGGWLKEPRKSILRHDLALLGAAAFLDLDNSGASHQRTTSVNSPM